MFWIYLIMWPFYFRIAKNSLKHYLVKYDSTKSSLETFLLYLNFPFSLLASEAWQKYGFVDRGALKLLENIDVLKKSNENFRVNCFIYSIPSILMIVAAAFGLRGVARLNEAMPNLTILTLSALTLLACWRFGNKLRNIENI